MQKFEKKNSGKRVGSERGGAVLPREGRANDERRNVALSRERNVGFVPAGLKIWQLVVGLVVVIIGGVIFAGAMAGWFDGNKAEIDDEYYTGVAEYLEIVNAEQYEALVGDGKSFVLMIDQGGCTTADKLRDYLLQYMRDTGVQAFRMMFDDMKETSLHENVKFYPSVVIVSKGQPVGWLKADSDEDSNMYNDYNAFRGWIDGFVKKKTKEDVDKKRQEEAEKKAEEEAQENAEVQNDSGEENGDDGDNANSSENDGEEMAPEGESEAQGDTGSDE